MYMLFVVHVALAFVDHRLLQAAARCRVGICQPLCSLSGLLMFRAATVIGHYTAGVLVTSMTAACKDPLATKDGSPELRRLAATDGRRFLPKCGCLL